MNCVHYGVEAGIAVGAAVYSVDKYGQSRWVNGGFRLLTRRVSRSIVGSAITAAFAAGWSIGSAVDCLYLLASLPEMRPVAVGYNHTQPIIEARKFQVYRS